MSRGPSSAPPPQDAAPLPAVRWLVPLLVLHSGFFLALASPQRPNAFAWPIALVPLFLALDLALRGRRPGWRSPLLRVLGCALPVGWLFGMLTGGWVVNTAYVFGALPLPLAYGASWLGLGTLFGLEVTLFLALPFALTWRHPLRMLVTVPPAAAVLQLYAPRFLYFTYGQSMFTVAPLVQAADVLGSAGLELLYLPLQLVLYLWLRRLFAPAGLPLRALAAATAAVALLFAAAYGYGSWQMQRWAAREAAGRTVRLVGIQPNFSLRELAWNPALSPSEREQSLQALLADSDAALERAGRNDGVPTVLLWPESVYPRPFFVAEHLRAIVQGWVAQRATHLILASIDGRRTRAPDGTSSVEVFGDAVHLGPDGAVRGVYHKIALIPWGERIPFGDWFPAYRRFLLEHVAVMSEFTPGREHTVFTLENGVRIAPMICFDAADRTVAQGMAANGARIGVVLANLAWFGATSVSNQFAWFARFRAIENRMPVLLLSQNGESQLFDSRGQAVGARLPQFQAASLVQQVGVPEQTSFYALHARAVEALYPLALLAVVLLGWRREGMHWLRGLRAGRR